MGTWAILRAAHRPECDRKEEMSSAPGQKVGGKQVWDEQREKQIFKCSEMQGEGEKGQNIK